MSDRLEKGVYKHFKGKLYELILEGRDSETLEEVVVYRALYNDERFGFGAVWVRPKKMFTETVIKDGAEVKRFEFRGKDITEPS